MKNVASKPLECRRCEHYFITWHPHFPHGCRAFGFKSKRLPCLEVRSASQLHCLKFSEKRRHLSD
ncbi:MAG: hypothetical protein Q9M11_03300 [Mariprofundaceae bacterium]|nr:hypothetical protein [Mariprofundaceae bacterium]